MQAQRRFVYVFGRFRPCVKLSVAKTSRGDPKTNVLSQQNIGGCRNSVFSVRKNGISIGACYKEAATLFLSPYGMGANRVPPTVTFEKVRFHWKAS